MTLIAVQWVQIVRDLWAVRALRVVMKCSELAGILPSICFYGFTGSVRWLPLVGGIGFAWSGGAQMVAWTQRIEAKHRPTAVFRPAGRGCSEPGASVVFRSPICQTSVLTAAATQSLQLACCHDAAARSGAVLPAVPACGRWSRSAVPGSCKMPSEHPGRNRLQCAGDGFVSNSILNSIQENLLNTGLNRQR